MYIQMLKSKIHRATVTDANLNYEGSITVDKKLMDAAKLLPFEKVQVLNITTGARAETYVIEGVADSGEICCNGALARLAQIGDLVIIISYGIVDENEVKSMTQNIVFVNDKNKIVNL